jgi:small subunit ribosomal protein S6
MKDAVGKFEGILKENGAKMVNTEMWGLRKLAYQIQHKSTGFYNLIEFQADSSVISKLETEYRRDEAVLRFLTVTLDKHAMVYNERRRKGEFKKKKNEAVEEPVL